METIFLGCPRNEIMKHILEIICKTFRGVYTYQQVIDIKSLESFLMYTHVHKAKVIDFRDVQMEQIP